MVWLSSLNPISTKLEEKDLRSVWGGDATIDQCIAQVTCGCTAAACAMVPGSNPPICRQSLIDTNTFNACVPRPGSNLNCAPNFGQNITYCGHTENNPPRDDGTCPWPPPRPPNQPQCGKYDQTGVTVCAGSQAIPTGFTASDPCPLPPLR